jgi:phosphonoacetaldehyde hydrolase
MINCELSMMNFHYTRAYYGPVQLVVVDLAGTTVDYGSSAPAGAFVELFRRHQIDISQAQARGPMGLHKKDHIRTIANFPEVKAAWQQVHGMLWTEDTIEALYQEFIPIQIECLPRSGKLIPGTVEAVKRLHELEIKIAVTTGYNEDMMDIVLKGAEEQGFVPDTTWCATQVATGRPAPWLIYRSMEALGIYPPEAVVKIGDTLPDIEAGLNAGVWTIGVAKTGNMIGLNEAELEALSADEYETRLSSAYHQMYQAGAHYVVDSISDCPEIVVEISKRLAAEDRP